MDDALIAALDRAGERLREALARELMALGCDTPVETREDSGRVTIGCCDTSLRVGALGRVGRPPDDRFRQAAVRALRALRRAREGEDR